MNITMVTGNRGKLAELQAMVAPLGHEVTAYAGGYPEIQAESLQDVTHFGARALLRSGVPRPFVLDDSGLFVHALNGFPGVYSRHALETVGLAGLLRLLDGKADRSAHFATDLCWVDDDGVRSFAGRVDGRIAASPSGQGGFGYDPIFIPDGHEDTFAQMGQAQKNALSHRGKAVRALLEHLRSQAAKA